MSADEYNKSQKEPINEDLLIGETMKYQNKSIIKSRGCKTWHTRYRYNGKQYTISGKTQQEVYNKLKLALKNISIEEDVKSYTLKYWIEKWKRLYKQDLRERSINDLNYYLDKIPNSLNKKPIKDIKTIELTEVIQSLNGDRQKNKMYTFINDLLDKAVKNEVIPKNPLAAIEKPSYIANEKYALSLTEENKLYEKLKGNKDLFIYAIAMCQGLRTGELLALEYKDINFENMTITVNKAIDNKTSDEDVKNTYSNRVVPLFKKTYEIIKDIDTRSDRRIVTVGERTLNRKLKQLVADITKEDITLYNLRHTFVTRMQDKKIPNHIIQHWIGHRIGSSVTQRVYTHVTKETEDKYINILNEE